ncbi:hypothetical protein Ahy_A04g017949 [Arachis hypogaea]|uniref:Myb/SANT-like domain-containing protein n=1 Tax=Arachis hypogaea TaxID=3818 RepID=A0A445DCG5_ARAHY|nr:hypothetical protein Ahy_A04g017949 [Arachis hypogaea]
MGEISWTKNWSWSRSWEKNSINPEFAKFKNKGPKSLDRLEQCFKDIIATGYDIWAPSKDQNFESGGDINYTNELFEKDIFNYIVVQNPTREKRKKTHLKNELE